MIKSILDQQLAICAVLMVSSTRHKDLSLEAKDVKIFEKLSEVSQPFEEITIKLSADSYATVSVVAPVMHQLLHKITKVDQEDQVLGWIQENFEQRPQKQVENSPSERIPASGLYTGSQISPPIFCSSGWEGGHL